MLAPSFVSLFPARRARIPHPRQRITRCALEGAADDSGSSAIVVPRNLSLPTFRERLYLQSLNLIRPRARAPRYTRAQHLTLMAWPLVQAPPEPIGEPRYPVDPVPAWAYIVRVRATKSVFGKLAVVRNRAKRRIKAAACKVMPAHARRGWEYVFVPYQSVLEADFEELVFDIEDCLRCAGCYKDTLVSEEVVRPFYCGRYR